MFFDIFLNGGIGTKLLRLMAGFGDAIDRKIKPEDVRIIDYFYPEGEINHTGNSLDFHNKESIFNYMNILPFNYMRTNKQLPTNRYRFDKMMAEHIVRFLASKDRNNYCEIHTNIMSKEGNGQHLFWIRGKDRPSNIEAFNKIAEAVGTKNKIGILTNDRKMLKTYPLLNKNYKSITSFEDFKLLLNSKAIYSQMSGFTLTPYLLSPNPQNFCLLDKNLHCNKEYAYLDKDWLFYMHLFKLLNSVCPYKTAKIVRLEK